MTVRECINRLWKFSGGFRWQIVRCALAGVLHVAVSLSFVYVCKHLIDAATAASGVRLSVCIGAMLACMALQLVLSALRSRLSGRVEIRLCNRLRYRLFVRLMESRWMGRERFHTGDVLNRLEEDVYTVAGAVCRTTPTLAVTIVQLCGALLFLSWLDARLAGILVFIMPLCLLFSKGYVRTMRRMSREIRDADSRIQSHLQEQLRHRILIRILEYTPQSVGRLAAWQSDLEGKTVRRADFAIFSRSMVQCGFAAGYAAAFLWGIGGLRDGTVTFGMMTAFLQLVAQVQRPMVDISRQIPSFIRVFTSVERLEELAVLPAEEQGVSVCLSGSPGIRAVQLDFAYPDGRHKIFDGFTHDFKPGTLTAIIGETGVGKSTLFRLLLGVLKPDKGHIILYNATSSVEASPLTRGNFSYVPQGNTLMSGTIRDNLLMGNPEATDDELASVLHQAAADFVFALPGGLDSRCDEQGGGLSEGQAQRIAIARGLLRPGGILLLDEPTASLDAETERLLLQRLSGCVQGKTLILITHREAAAQLCKEVVRLEKR